MRTSEKANILTTRCLNFLSEGLDKLKGLSPKAKTVAKSKTRNIRFDEDIHGDGANGDGDGANLWVGLGFKNKVLKGLKSKDKRRVTLRKLKRPKDQEPSPGLK